MLTLCVFPACQNISVSVVFVRSEVCRIHQTPPHAVSHSDCPSEEADRRDCDMISEATPSQIARRIASLTDEDHLHARALLATGALKSNVLQINLEIEAEYQQIMALELIVRNWYTKSVIFVCTLAMENLGYCASASPHHPPFFSSNFLIFVLPFRTAQQRCLYVAKMRIHFQRTK